MGGCVIVKDDKNLIIAEGGARAIRKFKKVMSKIKWNPEPEEDAEEGAEKPAVPPKEIKCNLLWEVLC